MDKALEDKYAKVQEQLLRAELYKLDRATLENKFVTMFNLMAGVPYANDYFCYLDEKPERIIAYLREDFIGLFRWLGELAAKTKVIMSERN